MTPTYLRDCMVVLGWNATVLANQLYCPEELVREWTRGTSSVPRSVIRWLDLQIDTAALLPVPTLSRTGDARAKYLGPERRKSGSQHSISKQDISCRSIAS